MNDHVCRFTVYSHTSYGLDDWADVFNCADPDCPAWDYGPRRPYTDAEILSLHAEPDPESAA